MVFTRSKARQKAAESTQSVNSEDDVSQTARSSARSVRKARRKSAVQEARDLNSGQAPSAGDEGTTESLEELALRAFHVMKERLGEEAPDEGDRNEIERDTNTQSDVMMLETEADSGKKGPVPGKLRHRSGVLATSLRPCMEETPYFSFSRKRGLLAPAGKAASLSWGESEEELMKKSVITSDFEKRHTAPPMHVSKYARVKAQKEVREKSAGSGWYDMKAPQMTTELQNDLKLLRMRNALDPSQHYKGSDWKKLPRYFQVGKVVSGPAEFYSSRIPRRQRKQTIMDELLHNHQFRRYQKKKYSELQRKFASGARRKRFIKHKKQYKK